MNAPDHTLMQLIAADLGISEAFVEKDWHVVQIIATLSQLEHGGFKPVFSGGTSLSKAYGLIKRFSEDVDFKVVAPDTIPSAAFPSKSAYRKACTAYRQAVIATLQESGWAIDERQIDVGNAAQFFAIPILYPPIFAVTPGLRPHVRVEMSIGSPALPFHVLSVQSFVSQARKNRSEAEAVACVSAVETAADKLSVLVWRVLTRQRGASHDDPTLIRHLYDLAALEALALHRLLSTRDPVARQGRAPRASFATDCCFASRAATGTYSTYFAGRCRVSD